MNFQKHISQTGELVEEETEEEETENEICSCGCEDCIYGENCPSSVNVAEANGTLNPLVTYSYNTGALRTQVATVTYRNDATESSTYQYEYDADGNITNISINNNLKHTITYGSLGKLIEIDNVGGRKVKYTDNGTYIYNAENQLIYTSVADSEGKEYEENYGIKYKEQEAQYSYDSATGYSTESTALDIASYYRISQSAVTDWFGREKSHTTTVYDITEETEETLAETIGKISTEYSYSSATDGKTSNSIEKYVNKTYNGDSTEVRVFDGYSYEYDKQNRISAIKQLDVFGAETEMYSYEYDKLGQLVRYNDKVANKSYTYTYDNNGNILTKSEYAYTTGALTSEPQITTYSYGEDWADKLTKVGTQEIEYDSIGNPTSYLGATLTWEGRELTSYSNDDYTLNYEYDENGMRYRTTVLEKKFDEVTKQDTIEETIYEYVWSDGKLISVISYLDGQTYTAKYLYNEFEEPIGMIYTDATNSMYMYYYLRNPQGDITHIVDSYGKKIITFSYDAFGKISTNYNLQFSIVTPLGMAELALKRLLRSFTPFGYRGYCYDTFTGLYYLQSRYYDPNVGRFINADDTNYLNATGTVLGCNLFAYCENDPVNKVDPRGYTSTSYIGNAFNKIFTEIKRLVKNFIKNSFGYIKNGSLYVSNSLISNIIDTIIYASSNAITATLKSASIKVIIKNIKNYARKNSKKVAEFLEENLFGKYLEKKIPETLEITTKFLANTWKKSCKAFC